ncbi:related to short-chain dehydrogenase/reductase family protein, putative [Phialocephala subalpina]|uniref:Related to short-chain dehydrogenase/reductase family protein, putative n=1 Tax=Phialocephala subalpina TaxID=576137 RepID=A0A1L7WJ69_9HELO|nr:related to short-chain dehydrogenase/reductase family protein, putative [Phialocephala subalpina]
MPPLKSIDLPPHKEGFGTIFLKSQFCAKPKWAPKSTNLSGKVALITGGGSGLGFHASRQLLSFKLSHLIITVRSMSRGEDAASKLRTEYPTAKIEVWELEMSSYDSIQSLARRAATLPRIDIVILNAGIVKPDFSVVEKTGHEEVIQVNYLSTVLLAILLLPILKTKSASTPGRLTIVNSGTSYRATFENRNAIPLLPSFDDDKDWEGGQRYACSKLLGHLFLVKLIGYISVKDVVVNLVDPGLSKSRLNRDTRGAVKWVMWLAEGIAGRTMEVGASTYVDAAVVKGAESHGCFVMDWEVKPFAKMVYEPEGKGVIDRLWEETLDELEFAGVKGILKELEGRK